MEEAVLGAAMFNGDALTLVLDRLGAGDFYSPHHRTVFEGIVEAARRGAVDEATVSAVLDAKGKLGGLPGGRVFVLSLVERVPAVANVSAYVDVVVDKAARRRLIEAGHEAVRLGYEAESASEATVRAGEAILGVSGTETRAEGFQRVTGPEIASRFEEAYIAPAKAGDAIPLRIDELNLPGGGMRRGEVWIFGGYSGDGKSWFELDVAEAATAWDARVAIFSMEMPERECIERLIAMQGVNYTKLRRREIPVADLAKPMERLRERVLPRLTILDGPASPTTVRMECHRAALRGEGYRVVILDHLHLLRLRGGTQGERRIAMDDALADMKAMAKQLGMTVVVLSQLTEAGDPKTPFPQPTNQSWRENKAIPNIADYAGFVYRRRDGNRRTDDALVIMTKVRSGEMPGSVHCKWNGGGTYRFDPVVTRPKGWSKQKSTQETIV
jgi:replicative DNA helicase